MDEVTLIAPGGIRVPIERLIPDFERKTGHKVVATFGSGGGTRLRIMSGEVFDVPIVQPPLSEVLATGHVVASTETPLASVPVAVAVRKGATKPDIATPDAVRKMLLAAKSVAYPDPARGAAAGVSFDETLRKLGIADAMQPKLVRAQRSKSGLKNSWSNRILHRDAQRSSANCSDSVSQKLIMITWHVTLDIKRRMSSLSPSGAVTFPSAG
jgi:ABC-type molybdate transport system substrate-binding protein